MSYSLGCIQPLTFAITVGATVNGSGHRSHAFPASPAIAATVRISLTSATTASMLPGGVIRVLESSSQLSGVKKRFMVSAG